MDLFPNWYIFESVVYGDLWFKCLRLYCAIFGYNLDRPADNNIESVKMQQYSCRIFINISQGIEITKIDYHNTEFLKGDPGPAIYSGVCA